MGALEDPKFLEHATDTESVANLVIAWVGNLRSRVTGLALLEGTETALGGGDQALPFTEREAGLGHGLGLSFL